MKSLATKVLKKTKTKNVKEDIKNYLLMIKKIGLKVQHQLDDYNNIGKKEFENIRFTHFFASFNEAGNASRIIFKPIQVDNGTYIRIGLFNNELKFFDKVGRPIIFPNNFYTPSDITKNIDELLISEKIVIDRIIDKCTTETSINNIKEIYNYLRTVKVEDGQVTTKQK